MHFGLLCLIRTLPNALLWHLRLLDTYQGMCTQFAFDHHAWILCVCTPPPTSTHTPTPSTPRKCKIFSHSFIHSFIYAFIYPVWQKKLTSLNTRWNIQLWNMNLGSHTRSSPIWLGVEWASKPQMSQPVLQFNIYLSFQRDERFMSNLLIPDYEI